MAEMNGFFENSFNMQRTDKPGEWAKVKRAVGVFLAFHWNLLEYAVMWKLAIDLIEVVV